MAWPKGNEYYKLRSKDGRDKIFETPEDLTEACNEYFQWIQDNPFHEAQLVNKSFIVKKDGQESERVPYSIAKLPKMRAMSLEGLCNFIDISVKGFKLYETRKDFIPVTARVRQIIDAQQFEGAASGFLNHSIIARKLGLVDRQDRTTGGEKLNKQTIDLSGLDSDTLEKLTKSVKDKE